MRTKISSKESNVRDLAKIPISTINQPVPSSSSTFSASSREKDNLAEILQILEREIPRDSICRKNKKKKKKRKKGA